MMEIRPYRASDEAAVRDVCLRTGDLGGDATPLYQDREVVSDVFAMPYMVFDPECAFVADNGERAVGYIVGTPDTARFARQWRDEWLPRVAARHTVPPAAPDWANDLEGTVLWILHHPEQMVDSVPAGYPAHLHINLLPEAQGRGVGRELVQRLCTVLKAAGAEGVHLQVAERNVGARAFYARLGFQPLPAEAPEPGLLGRSTTWE